LETPLYKSAQHFVFVIAEGAFANQLLSEDLSLPAGVDECEESHSFARTVNLVFENHSIPFEFVV
jgi:hypothetical protein